MRLVRLLTLVVLFLVLNPPDSNGQSVSGGQGSEENSGRITTSVFFEKSTQELIVRNELKGSYLVQVFNLTGTEVLRHEVNNANIVKIAANKLKNGVYLVRIAPVPNQAAGTFKIMVN